MTTNNITLSSLPHTWLIDIDGTIVKHNGYKIDGYDTLLDGVKDFFNQIDKNDKIILLTAREGKYLEDLKLFLKENNIRYDYLLTDMPVGERILINDNKPSGLVMGHVINKKRDDHLDVNIIINEKL